MNITLSVDEELIEKARKLAKAQGKTLNQMIRENDGQFYFNREEDFEIIENTAFDADE